MIGSKTIKVAVIGGGAAGSITRQRIIDPDAEIDQGQLVADSLINLIPGVGVGKSVVKDAPPPKATVALTKILSALILPWK